MTEQQQQPEKIELLTQGVQHEMIFNEGIGVIKNYASKEWCKLLIDAFEMYNATKLSKNVLDGHYQLDTTNDGESQFRQGSMGRKDEQLFLEVADAGMASTTNQIVGGAFEHYVKEYKGVVESSDPVSSWTCKIQKTQKGGGYHIWHCEDGGFMYRDRVLTWMLYLNDIPVENGGATDFLHQKCSFQPTVGTMVMWPATYTHMHRGSFLTGDTAKYIATGWFLREPGAVSERIIGEKLGTLPIQTRLNQ